MTLARTNFITTYILKKENKRETKNSNSHFENINTPLTPLKGGIPLIKSPFEGGFRGMLKKLAS
jgi:hypothetical protein